MIVRGEIETAREEIAEWRAILPEDADFIELQKCL